VTTGLFTRATETTRASLLGTKTIRTPVALPTDVADAKRSVTAGHATPGHARTGPGLAGADRRRLGTAIGGLAVIFLVLTIAGVAARHIHLTPVNTTPSTSTVAAAAGAKTTDATATNVTRLSNATIAVTSATTALGPQLATFGPIPTPQQVAMVTAPFADTLKLYGTVLDGTTVPASAAPQIRALDGQLRADIASFSTVGAVPSPQLGQFFNSFNLRVAVLQSDLAKLAHVLRSAAGAHPSTQATPR
jgi:hypothetical protein